MHQQFKSASSSVSTLHLMEFCYFSFACCSSFFSILFIFVMSGFESISGHKSSLTISLQHFYYIHSECVLAGMGYVDTLVLHLHRLSTLLCIFTGNEAKRKELCRSSGGTWVHAGERACDCVHVSSWHCWTPESSVFDGFSLHRIISFTLLHAHTCYS